MTDSQGDKQGDNPLDNQGDNVKTLVDKGIDQGDNHLVKSKVQSPKSKVSQKSEEKNKLSATVKNQEVKPAPKQINWQSYPYNSSSEKSRKERAGKVVEKILSCSTSNELIELKISEREITWLKENVLTTAEREQVKEIESTRQGNLFAQKEIQGEELRELDWAEVISGIDREMKRIAWSVDEGKNYLKSKYGVKSRRGLTNGQIIEFWNYLKRI